ncbi:membrane protein [Spirochaetia bacterium]|nr:membrane protein [Spirochaetia bacterium]
MTAIGTLFYTLIIYPLVQLIEVVYLFAYRLCDNFALALLGLSLAVSTMILPLYFIAEKWQDIERETQKRLAPKIAKIKAVFKGDEQYLILSTFYKENHYHPVYALRNTFSLLIQIPFFISAYTFISHLDVLQNTSFAMFRNLGAPDGLLVLGGHSINILPILMTAINCASGAIYSRNLGAKDRVQIYGTAALFLVLLYNSPAALVIYWTYNNIYSLCKNLLQKMRHPRRIVWALASLAALAVAVWVLFFRIDGALVKRLAVAAVCALVVLFPVLHTLARKALAVLSQSDRVNRLSRRESAVALARPDRPVFVLSCVLLFVLCGLTVPASLIASSVEEFSFVGDFTTPFPFLGNVALQAAGFFLFWPLCIYALMSPKAKRIAALAAPVFAFAALVNTFLFYRDYGWLTPLLVFSNPREAFTLVPGDRILFAGNIAALLAIAVIVLLVLTRNKANLVVATLTVALMALCCAALVNMVTVNSQFRQLVTKKTDDALPGGSVITLAQDEEGGRNVVLFMLDRAASDYVPYILEEKPELREALAGFTYYPNTVSLAPGTFLSTPSLFGGYEYTPRALSEKSGLPLSERYRQSYTMLPNLFAQAGFDVILNNLPINETRRLDMRRPLSLTFDGDVTMNHFTEVYAGQWLKEHPDVGIYSVQELLLDRLIRFSFFKISPAFLKMFIYDNGEWLTAVILNDDLAQRTQGVLTMTTVETYAILDFLPRITAVKPAVQTDGSRKNADSAGTFTIFVNDLTHEEAFLQAPDYTPASPVTNYGSGPFARSPHYHVNMAAFLRLSRWFDHLKANGVWDNTRIIITSDHGIGQTYANSPFENTPVQMLIPKGGEMSAFHPLLFVKDFGSRAPFTEDHTFMTLADVPALAAEGIIDDAKNPFTGVALQKGAPNGAFITTGGGSVTTLDLQSGEWLHVHDDIFDPANWSEP